MVIEMLLLINMKNIIQKSVSALLALIIVFFGAYLVYLFWYRYFALPAEMEVIKQSAVPSDIFLLDIEPDP